MDAIKRKDFREDIYYRLSVVEINVPPPRESKSEVPLLVDKFAQKYGEEYKDRLLRITPDALHVMQRYHWPGNILELDHIIQRAAIMCEGIINVKDLPDNLKFQIDFLNADLLPLGELEKEYVQGVPAYAGGNKTKAAVILQNDRKTLGDKLNRTIEVQLLN